MKHHLSALLIATCLTSISAPIASAQTMSEGKRLSAQVFKSVDAQGRGYVDVSEFSAYGDSVFISMDENEDGILSVDEFLAWDFGMAPYAEKLGAQAALETSMRVVHSFWDRDGDGELTHAEYRYSTISDFQRADIDGDAVLTEAEFLSGFTVMKALRSAITPFVK